jgi:hypothetical protein
MQHSHLDISIVVGWLAMLILHRYALRDVSRMRACRLRQTACKA